MEQAKIVHIDSSGRRRPQQRMPVPASIFVGRAEPSFVLFDARGGLCSPEAVRTVFVSPADLPALDGYVRTHLRALSADPYLEPADSSWILQRVVLHEAREALQLRRGYHPRGLISVSKQVAAYALTSGGRFSYLGDTGEERPSVHATNRALYAAGLAATSGISDPAELSGIVIAAVFADSGNVVLPPEQLTSSGQLTEEQWRLMRGHPERSAEIMQRSGIASELVLRAVRGHHERWDGGGYPRGLRGPQIPIEGRILAIADSFSAMTSRRPHAEQRDAYEALREMSADRGQFDPQLLRKFVPLAGRAIGQLRRSTRAG